ncbi:MAG: hypothetical protein GX793_06995 [Bacteroidales bacterium]|jgi:hypothetical protein|nr:hypothetical protein [Bacteroidales bacterium]MCK9499142.1 hypothetical protein [Bacteroidales bacterium]MDY0314497.1 hypothetical protein [Bacteroidales bacterium]NLB86791.1 hypothetical protein [Bacteroidales bacterium]
MKTQSLLFVFFLISTVLFSQNDEIDSYKTARISDVNFQVAYFTEEKTSGNIQDFILLAPNSDLLKIDFSDYNKIMRTYLSEQTCFSINLGLQFVDKSKLNYRKNPNLRLGLTYFSGTNSRQAYSKKDYTTIDSLYFLNTDYVGVVDSINYKTIDLKHYSEQLHLDFAVLFRTKPEARWSLYTGLGLSAGISVNTKVEISFSESTSVQASSLQLGFMHLNPETYLDSMPINQDEIHKTKLFFAISGYIPLGIDFRIGKKRDFWKHTHLFYELRPSLNYSFSPEIGRVNKTYMLSLFGIKVEPF